MKPANHPWRKHRGPYMVPKSAFGRVRTTPSADSQLYFSATPEQIDNIISRVKSGESRETVARDYGVPPGYITGIVRKYA